MLARAMSYARQIARLCVRLRGGPHANEFVCWCRLRVAMGINVHARLAEALSLRALRQTEEHPAMNPR
jgi:hypothetical protein